MPKNWGFKIENCVTSEDFKNKIYPKIPKRMYGSLQWIEAGRAIRMLSQYKVPIHSLLNIYSVVSKNLTSATAFNIKSPNFW